MEVKEIIGLWEQVKESLDLKRQYIQFKEHEDPRADNYMYVDCVSIGFNNQEEIEYKLMGTLLSNHDQAGPDFDLSTKCSRTYYFSLQDLLENKSAVKDIEKITKEEFLSILDYNVECYKQIANSPSNLNR